MSLSPIYKKCVNGVVCISAGDGKTFSASSGFLIDTHHIVTCCHCVCDSRGRKRSVIKVYVDTGKAEVVDASIVGVDGTADIAVLKLKKPIPGATPLKWAPSDPEIGDQAVLIGNPFGDVQSVSNAYIRDTSFYGSSLLPTVMESVLIDGSAIGGNSGGPLLNMNGEVIGVLAYGYNNVSGGTMNGAVPAWFASYIASSIIYTKGDFTFGTLHAKVAPLYIDDTIHLGMDKVQGYMILSIERRGIATGLQHGDIITHVTVQGDTYEVGQLNSQYCIFSLIHLFPSERISVRILRNGKESTLSFSLPSNISSIPQNGIL